MDKQSLIRLLQYHYWANRQLWQSVMELGDKEFTQPLDNGSPSIKSLLIRMVADENLWINYLWHGEIEFLKDCYFPTRNCIRSEWDALEEEILDFLDDLNPAALENYVDAPFLNSGTSYKVWEILLRIIHQAAETRAQIGLHLERLGSPSPTEDFVDFFTEQQAIPA
jgi:uncharacterized damage-inducible protein DinB